MSLMQFDVSGSGVGNPFVFNTLLTLKHDFIVYFTEEQRLGDNINITWKCVIS